MRDGAGELRIHYRFHPLFRKRLAVRERHSRHGASGWVIRLPDGGTAAVPDWMFDPDACAAMQEVERPRAAAHALLEAAELLEAARQRVGSK